MLNRSVRLWHLVVAMAVSVGLVVGGQAIAGPGGKNKPVVEVSYVKRGTSSNFAPGGFSAGGAECPKGTEVIGGGVGTPGVGNAGTVDRSVPDPSANSWTTVFSVRSGGQQEIIHWAVCLRARRVK